MTGSVGFQATLITSTNYFVAALYNSSDVTTVLESKLIPKGTGYDPDFQVTFDYNLQQDVVYRCILWESPDDQPHGVSRVSGDFKASLNSIKLRADLYLTADVSAGLVSGTTGYVDPTSSLAGWLYSLEQIGYGTLQAGAGRDYTTDATTNDWTLINGSQVSPQQKFVLHFQPQVSAAPQPPVSQITSGRIIKVSETLTGADKNKQLIVRATGSSIACPLPRLDELADWDRVVINSNGGNHLNATFACQNSDLICHFSKTSGGSASNTVSQIILGQNEKLELYKFTDPDTGTAYYWIDDDLPGVNRVGEIFETYDPNVVNAIIANGSLQQRTILPRLLAAANHANAFVAEANWADTDSNGYFKNKAFYTQGTDASNFRIPDLTIYPSRRAVNGSRPVASFAAQVAPSHNHYNGIADDWTTGNGNNIFVYGGTTTGMPGLSKGNVGNTPNGGNVYQGLTSTAGVTEGHSSDTAVYVMIRI